MAEHILTLKFNTNDKESRYAYNQMLRHLGVVVYPTTKAQKHDFILMLYNASWLRLDEFNIPIGVIRERVLELERQTNLSRKGAFAAAVMEYFETHNLASYQ